MRKDDSGKSLTELEGNVPTEIDFRPTLSMDISGLDESERKALLLDHAKGKLDLAKKALELDIDSTALKKILDDMSDTTRDAMDKGADVTISHAQTTSVGRTEVLMGNTEHVKSGKLSRSQSGNMDLKPFYVIGGGILALILIAAILN